MNIKNKRRIFYISQYMPADNKYIKHTSPAAQTKIDYIRHILKDYNLEMVCVNCSLTVDNSILINKKFKNQDVICHVLFSLSSLHRIFLPLNEMIMLLSVFLFILFNVKKNDIVILYHSIYYDFIVQKLKKIKKYKLIYEVEEIYADVRDKGKGREEEIFKCESYADAFIFPTELLNTTVNVNNKPKVVIYGAYKPQQCREKTLNNENEKVLIVYSGTLMKGKGATQAIESAKFLDERYEIRILGYGSKEEIESINNMIQNSDLKCKVVYDGLKYNKEYINYLSKCQIGLCIQPTECLFNSTSFPSKVLSYLNCGLKVVATNLLALKSSQLSEYIYFVNDDSPECVAQSIKKISNFSQDNYSILKKLDCEASNQICRIIEDFQ